MKDPRESMIEAFMIAVDCGIELLVAVSDSTSTSKIAPFAERFPDRVINVGIAEQNLVGLSAGLALGGYVVVTSNAAPFLVNRSAEQVRNDIAYTATNVKMMGLNPGVAYGALGPTHHSLEDISMMRSLGGVDIYTPVDPLGTGEAVRHVLNHDGPAYVRVDSGKFPDIPRLSGETGPDLPIALAQGNDITLLGLGTSSHAVKAAAERMHKDGISVEAWAVPSIRPLALDAVVESIAKTGLIVTVEAHSTHGGLGSLVAEVIAEKGLSVRLKRLGIPEGQFAPASPRSAIEREFLLDEVGIVFAVKEMLNLV
jgi:transketolase